MLFLANDGFCVMLTCELAYKSAPRFSFAVEFNVGFSNPYEWFNFGVIQSGISVYPHSGAL